MYKEIPQVSRFILDLLRDALCPHMISSREDICLILPAEKETNYRLGIWLYDILEYSQAAASGYEYIEEHIRRFPPKAVELSYLIILNEEKKFGNIAKEEAQMILSQIIRTFHDHSWMDNEGGKINLNFSMLNIDMKLKLWGSLGKPIQAAVYIHAAPVLIGSSKEERYTAVRHGLEIKLVDKNEGKEDPG